MNECQQPEPLPKISVITPSFQQGEFIEATIQSVISQKYPSMEYLVIDGGSSDNSVAIINKYKYEISYWVSEPDRGQTDALNKGFRKSTGEIVCWVNSDDILLPGALRTAGMFFSKHPEVIMIYGDALVMDRVGKILHTRIPGPFNLRWLIRTDDIPQSSVFFRRDFLVSIGYLDDRLHFALDYDFLLKAALVHDLQYIPETLSGFRIYPETKTAQGKAPFSVEIVYSVDRILRSFTLSEEQKISLLTTQFWRLFELLLALDENKDLLEHLKNDPEVKHITCRYLEILHPHFHAITRCPFLLYLPKMRSLMADAMRDLLYQYPDQMGLSNERNLKQLVYRQNLDLLIFCIRLWRSQRRMDALRLFSNIFFRIPGLFLDSQFRKIVWMTLFGSTTKKA